MLILVVVFVQKRFSKFNLTLIYKLEPFNNFLFNKDSIDI